MYGNLYSQNNMSQIDTVLQHLIAFGSITRQDAKQYKIKYLGKCISRSTLFPYTTLFRSDRGINIKTELCDSIYRSDSALKAYVLCKDQPMQVKKMIDSFRVNNLKKTA